MVLHLHNASRKSDDEVNALIDFALADIEGVDWDKVGFSVKNSACAYRGRAYSYIPAVSPFRHVRGLRYLVTIWFGPDKKYPADNLRTTKSRQVLTDWIPWGEHERHDGTRAYKARNGKTLLYDPRYPTYGSFKGELAGFELTWDMSFQGYPAKQHIKFWRYVYNRNPYGGKKSPLITVNNWRESLISVAAHEGWHIKQFGQRRERYRQKICHEYECEIAADAALRRYREGDCREDERLAALGLLSYPQVA